MNIAVSRACVRVRVRVRALLPVFAREGLLAVRGNDARPQ
jgi:hypothetical protein